MKKRVQPYLSIIVAARNDDHGGNFIKRFQNFLNSIFFLNKKYHFPLELIIVEWNTPDYKPSIYYHLNFSLKPNSCTVKFISVPSTVHKKFKYSDKLLLYQMIAKNVGIRRAEGEFILCTNADIIFSKELFSFLSKMNLKKGCIYRTVRYDVDNKRLDFKSYNELIDYCKKNVIRINGYISSSLKDFKEDEFFWINILSNVERYNLFRNSNEKVECLFTNACGDFQLMHRDNWFELRGYPEFDQYSFHIDSILEYQAFYSGLKEMILTNEKCIYHIEHDSGFIPEKKKEFEIKYPTGFRISDSELEYYRIAIKNSPKPKIFNDINWGLINESQIKFFQKIKIPKIAFVAIPKGFENEFEIIQYNAINSWLNLSIDADVFLLCDKDFNEYKFNPKVKYIKELKYTKYGKPNLKSAFEIIKKHIKAEYIVLINSDIIMLDDFSKTAFNIIKKVKNDFFVVGKRINININKQCNFNNIHWWDEVFKISKKGIIDTELSMDYFFFHRNFLNGYFPEFSIGGMYWDNWLLSKAFKDMCIIIDASESITAVHQNHSYKNNFTAKDILNSDMAKENFKLMKSNLNKKHLGHIKLIYSKEKFFYKNGKEADINKIIQLHKNNFEINSEGYDESLIEYISSFISYLHDTKINVDFLLKNFEIFGYRPDALLSIAFTIIKNNLIKYFHMFSPFMQKVAEIGYLNGDNILGLRYKNKTNEHIKFWENQVKSGNDRGRLILSLIYYYGLGCEKDEKKGLMLLFNYYLNNKSNLLIRLLFFRVFFDAKKENYMLKFINYFKTEDTPETFYFLGMVYCRGIGDFIKKNERISEQYFIKAAEKGLTQGLNYLGTKFLMEKNLKKALYYFKLGSKYNDSLCIKNLEYLENNVQKLKQYTIY